MCSSHFERRPRGTHGRYVAAGLTAALAGWTLLLGGCEVDAPRYRFGENLGELRFSVFDPDEGIYPSQVILSNPDNPFRDVDVGTETKWDILARGGDVAAYYAWGTLLARGPYGELQFYTAKELSDLYQTGQADAAELPVVRDMAIRAFQSVLDNFPNDVTYDATGTTPFRLATPAYLGIQALGGAVTGGWVLVTTPSGGQEAVQGGLDK
jgi:hypothetical protein